MWLLWPRSRILLKFNFAFILFKNLATDKMALAHIFRFGPGPPWRYNWWCSLYIQVHKYFIPMTNGLYNIPIVYSVTLKFFLLPYWLKDGKIMLMVLKTIMSWACKEHHKALLSLFNLPCIIQTFSILPKSAFHAF